MKITLSWLKAHLKTDHSLADLTDGLNKLGLVVDEIIDNANALKGFIVAEITSCMPHPQADRLQICQVFTGTASIQIVCGAPNARAGLKTVLALPGTCIPASGMIIKKGAIRGVESEGMLCSATELSLVSTNDGIMELPDSAKPGDDFAQSQGYDDPVLVVEITPNRGDCLGVRGIARDLAAAGWGELIPLQDVYPVSLIEQPSIAAPQVIIAPETKTQGAWCFIENITDSPTPEWMQHRLKRCGHSCISAVVDVTNYLCYDLGRPLHAFDADTIQGPLQVRYAKAGEKFIALNEESYTLQESMQVVADDQGPLSLAGIMGGYSSACQPSTNRILLESAFFTPQEIAYTGREMQIHSDSRYRFERFVDPESILPGLKIAAQLITQIVGGHVSQIAYHYTPSAPVSLPFPSKTVEKLCGLSLEQTERDKILTRLGFRYTLQGEDYHLTVPSWRPDIQLKEDVVEELVRVKGYDHVPCVSLPPKAPSPAGSFIDQEAMIGRFLSSKGLSEIVTWSFISEKSADLFSTKEYDKAGLCLTNPLNPDLAVMRPNVLPGLIEAVARNAAHGHPNNAFFEIGPQFLNRTPQGQRTLIAGVRSGTGHAPHWAEKARFVDLYDSKSDILGLLAAFGIPETSLQIVNDAPAWYHPGRCATIFQGPKRILGYFGEIHPRIQKMFSCKNRLVAFELFKDFLGTTLPPRKTLKISPYQKVERDFSFMVPVAVNVDRLIKIIEKTNKNLVQKIDIFDLFIAKTEQENAPTNQKSVGLRVTLQSFEKTLTDTDIQDFCQQVITTIESQTDSILRKN